MHCNLNIGTKCLQQPLKQFKINVGLSPMNRKTVPV